MDVCGTDASESRGAGFGMDTAGFALVERFGGIGKLYLEVVVEVDRERVRDKLD
jgi:hypothetical protein